VCKGGNSSIISLTYIQVICSNIGDLNGYNQIKIITDEISPEYSVLDFNEHSQLLARIIENSDARFTVGIFGDWGTGKTTLMRMILKELSKNKKILPVWFDAWRYEKEDNLAVIPFLRTVSIALDNFLNKLEPKEEKSKWERLRSGVSLTFSAFIKSTKVKVGIAEIELEKMKESLTPPIPGYNIGKEIEPIYYHSTDFLEHALDEMRVGEDGKKYRLVVFVDDLDRCTPQNGLDVLESIKSFSILKASYTW
jgi:Cdc6-like AAA superfamily ATPase